MTIPTDLLARLRAAIADAKDDGHAYAVATRADLAALLALVEAPAPLTVDGCPGCAGALAGLVDTVCGTCRAAAVDAFAPPPEAPGERRPVAGWRAGVSANELFVGTFLRLRAGAIAWEVEAVKTSGLARWCDTLKSGIVTGGPVAAKLAAEDAAADLMRAGLAVLGRVK